MELRHLRYFVAVAEELHFGRAAQRLFIAQPPLSQQIQQLEKELGVPLLERTSRRVRLTPAGAAFLAEARQVLARVEGASQAARRAARGETGSLTVGFVASATYEVLPDVLRDFRAAFPDVELGLFELNAAEQAQALRDGDIQVGFARPHVPEPGVAAHVLSREPFLAALPDGHSLSVRDEIPLALLAGEPFIGFPAVPKPSYADLVLSVCQGVGFAPQVAQVVREMQTALGLVAAGMGVALVPASVRSLGRRGVALRPLLAPAPTTELVLVWRAEDPPPVLRSFLSVAGV